MTNDPRTHEEIERDIAAKRAVLTDNINQLKTSLSVGSIAQQVGKVGLKHAGGFGVSALKQVKKNPLPVATIAAGIAWLILSNSKNDAEEKTKVEPEPVQDKTYLDEEKLAPQDGILEAHPFVIGAVALAAGATLGALLPRSKTEDDLVASAKDLMRAQADRFSDVAQAMKDEAEDIFAETKGDLDRGAPNNQTAVDAVGGLAKEAADRILSAAVTASKEAKRG